MQFQYAVLTFVILLRVIISDVFRYYASLKDPGEGNVCTYDTNWDAKMMFGCNCDSGMFGPDCSLRSCPTGDDPFTGTIFDLPSLLFKGSCRFILRV